HGGLGDEERACDLQRGQPADRTESQCDGGCGRQRRVAAHEEEHERVVLASAERLVRRWRKRHVCGPLASRNVLATTPCHLTAKLVRRTTQGDAIQPAAWILRNPLYRPLLRRGDQCLLHCVLNFRDAPVTPADR